MRLMLSLLIFAVLIWSAYWFLGAQKNKTRMTDWIFEQRAQGWVIEFETLKQMGYPNRFDITLREPKIRTPEGAIEWQGLFLQDLRLSYKPNHSIIVFPKNHKFSFGKKVFHISNEQARASVITGPPQEHRIILEITNLEIATDGLKIEFPRAQLAILQEAHQHKVHVTLSSLNIDNKSKMNNLIISGDIEMPTAPNIFPIPIMNGLGARFTNLKVDIDGKTIINDGTITAAPNLELGGKIFTSRDIGTASGSQDSHVNHIQIEEIATPFGIQVSRMR